jgi:hypothetical protein
MKEWNKITKRVVTRFYVNGKGYNSEAAALEALGRIVVRNIRWDYGYSRIPMGHFLGTEGVKERKEVERQFMVRRYPCQCKDSCSRPNAPDYYGCLTAKRRDYRKLGKLLLDGIIDSRGRSTEPPSLPERCA